RQELPMSTVPKLLLVSPVFPDVTGFGLAMRAGAILEALSASCQVYLLIIPIYDPYRTAPSPHIGSWHPQYFVRTVSKLPNFMIRLGSMLPSVSTQPYRLYEWRHASAHMVRKAAQAFQDIQFDYLHVFRLYMTPYAMPYLHAQNNLTACYLDLDDV